LCRLDTTINVLTMTETTSRRKDIGSLYRCMPRCTLFSMSLACLRRSRSRFKARRNDNCCTKHGTHVKRKQKSQQGVFHGPQRAVQRKPASDKGKCGGHSSSPAGGRADGEGIVSTHQGRLGLSEGNCLRARGGRGRRDSRRRDSKMNGADIYVARVTKKGMGSAKPCWRCLHWCYWAGIKRIFHWDQAAGRWEVVKVNSPGRDQYETTADIRLYAGMGW